MSSLGNESTEIAEKDDTKNSSDTTSQEYYCANKRPRTSSTNESLSSHVAATSFSITHSTSIHDSASSDDSPTIELSTASSLFHSKQLQQQEPRTKVMRSSSSHGIYTTSSCCYGGQCRRSVRLEKQQPAVLLLPLAPSINDYIAPGGTFLYRPRPEWFYGAHNHPQYVATTTTAVENTASEKPTVFGKDWDSALHLAIRENATEAALALVRHQHHHQGNRSNNRGHPLITATNVKGVTPIILAAQRGNYEITKELLQRGADPASTSLNKTTAVLQAAHFGHCRVLQLLLQAGGCVEQANYNFTTPLMRASQEGHQDAVILLIQCGANVNRRNREGMSALMLAAQRGHADICQLLIRAGAHLEAQTAAPNYSTALLLAVKRGHCSVVKTLVTAGCEVCVQDSRGRTAQQIAMRHNNNDGTPFKQQELMDLLDPAVQIHLMQRQAAQQRNLLMVKLWHLLQNNRATVVVAPDAAIIYGLVHDDDDDDKNDCYDISIHRVQAVLSSKSKNSKPSFGTQALLRTMVLPVPLVESIAQFLPLPHLWSRRMSMLTSRATIAPDAAVVSTLDLIDEVLEQGGFVEACDAANVPPPSTFRNWAEWKSWGCRRRSNSDPTASTAGLDTSPASAVASSTNNEQQEQQPRQQQQQRLSVTTAVAPAPRDPQQPTILELRRKVGYLQTLAKYQQTVGRLLTKPPYNMPKSTLQQLVTVADVASLTRRMLMNANNAGGSTSTNNTGIHFETVIAMDLIMLTSRLCSWYWRERQEATTTTAMEATT